MVSKLKKILVPLDGSKNSLRGLKFAIDFAKQSKMLVIGLNVSSIPFYLKSREIVNNKKKNGEQIIHQAKIIAQKENVPFRGEVKSSENMGRAIVSFSENNKVDLIVIGSKGPDPEIELFLGSVANYVINKSKIPVTVIK